MRKLITFFVMFTAVALLWSCSSVKYAKNESASPSNTQAETVMNPKAESSTLKYPNVNTLNNENMSYKQLKKEFRSIAKDIHFKFNSYQIQPIDEYGINENPIDILNRIANFLKKHPNVKIRVEGNCDERGTIEYNLALGQKRALAAKHYLVTLGINPDRISIISYGKSRPLDPRHNPYAWAKNRRDHFVILK